MNFLQRGVAFADLGRLHTAGFAVFLIASGWALGGGRVQAEIISGAVVAGFALTFTAFAVNNLADLDVDRYLVDRSSSPLVAGTVTVSRARLSIVVGGVVSTVVLATLPSYGLRGGLCLLVLLIATALISFVQKRTTLVLLADFAYALVFVAALWFAAAANLSTPPRWEWAVALGALALQMNFSGNLKDLEADRLTRFHTLALALGFRESQQRLTSSAVGWVYALAIQATFVISVSALTVESLRAREWVLLVPSVATTTLLVGLLAGRIPTSSRGNDWYLAGNVLIFSVALAFAVSRSAGDERLALLMLLIPAPAILLGLVRAAAGSVS